MRGQRTEMDVGQCPRIHVPDVLPRGAQRTCAGVSGRRTELDLGICAPSTRSAMDLRPILL